MEFLKKNVDLKSLSQKDLELCTNYVLYGKDKDGTSMVDKKLIYIKSKHNSYQRQEPLSLEALLEDPNFEESQLKEPTNIYKKIKPSIDKEKVKDIPGMVELWEEIDKLDQFIQIQEGKVKPESPVKKVDSKTLYTLKHTLIDLRRQQYILKDSQFPEIQPRKNYSQFYSNSADYQVNYQVFPIGVMKDEHDIRFTEPWRDNSSTAVRNIEEEIKQLNKEGKFYFNFLDKNHIYQLCLYYYEVKDLARKHPDSLLNNLLLTLDFYIDKAHLSPQQRLILEDKKRRMKNEEISIHLFEELGIHHQENYISTIWNKTCKLVAAAANLHYDEWLARNYDKAWKICGCCGKKLLRDTRNFVRKNNSYDGLTLRCKQCDKKKRLGILDLEDGVKNK